jgi:hypothetical protein
MKTPSTAGSLYDITSLISVAGVMGYPAKKRQPAASAPSTMASLPCKRSWRPGGLFAVKLGPLFLIERQTFQGISVRGVPNYELCNLLADSSDPAEPFFSRTLMAKSGQWSSHQPHPVHWSEFMRVGAPSSSSRMHPRGQKAAQIPQDLHQSRNTSIS